MIRGELRKVVIPAAGLGTRFLPATKAQPKEMLPIFDKPAIQYVVEEAVASGVRDVIVVTGRNKQAIENHFDKSMELEGHLRHHGQEALLQQVIRIGDMANLIYTRQKEPLGLGHAVLCAKSVVGNEPFAVQLADDLIDSKVPAIRQLWDVAMRYGGSAIAVMEVPASQVSSYGIAAGTWVSDRVMRVSTMVEKPKPANAPSRYGIVGRYVLSPRVFTLLERTRRGAIGEIQLTDALVALAKEEPVFALKFEGRRFDVGNKVGYVEASLFYALRDRDAGPKVRALLRRTWSVRPA